MPLSHRTVLPAEAIEALKIQPGSKVLDGTFGGGGHSRAILEQLSQNGRLLIFDRDFEAYSQACKWFGEDSRVVVRNTSFAQLKSALLELNWIALDAVLLDLGVSSIQLKNPARGFSFQLDGPLDMRMDQNTGQGIARWLASASLRELVRVFKSYGEEPYAARIARAIIAQREQGPITRTRQLAELVAKVVPRPRNHKHPATQVFLALRVKVNDELEHLRHGLREALDSLAPKGRLVVISFHSLEDRLVKQFFKAAAGIDQIPRDIPLSASELDGYRKGHIPTSAIKPSVEEVARNRRSRSAVMRVFEKAA